MQAPSVVLRRCTFLSRKELYTMQPFTFPFAPKPVRMVVAFVLAGIAMVAAGIVTGLFGAIV